ncbi:hypothetical protein [Chryseobacterium sp. MEBOG07]|uniref:hypothetical protein n=1 Tax=Chryseobacterium sp. MEBOG07 TaxID=2879939 RepID=UPI001F300FF6|nr:hypothetical protein [Chryseobacterium sp. MEBOG07]UKB78328.1 hypothetical protein LF886_17855 [Chryseobacterium sp. MEBOG07]
MDVSVSTFSADSVHSRLASGSFSNSQDFGVLVGSLRMKNSSSLTKTYYLHYDNIFSTGVSKRLEFVFDNWNETLISYMRAK